MKQLGSTDLKRLHRTWRRRDPAPAPLGLLLENLQGPFNVGSIVRTAAAYRVTTLWVVGDGAGPGDTKVEKTAMGTGRYLEVIRTETTDEAVADVAARRMRLVGLELADGAGAAHETDLTGALCLAIGHEDRGVSQPLLDACDSVIFLPLLGKVGSLNVATATAISLYEVSRQRWSG